MLPKKVLGCTFLASETETTQIRAEAGTNQFLKHENYQIKPFL